MVFAICLRDAFLGCYCCLPIEAVADAGDEGCVAEDLCEGTSGR